MRTSKTVLRHMDRAIDHVLSGRFKRARLRGDTAFSLTQNFDCWDEESVEFVFGYNATKNLVERADSVSEWSWAPLKRRTKRTRKTSPRTRPENVKQRLGGFEVAPCLVWSC